MNFIFKTFFLIFSTLFIIADAKTQDTIHLQNPSFEDVPRRGGDSYRSIKKWADCGLIYFPLETPPDIHPTPAKAWGVSMEPYAGKTYLGLVVRYNDTYEAVSQKLQKPLKAGTCYTLSAYLARSNEYNSLTAASDELQNFNKPCSFIIWGGMKGCTGTQILVDSGPVKNSEWMKYEFIFKPQQDFEWITIEAYFTEPVTTAYNGHVLVDNLSPIIEIVCSGLK